jgi:acyl-CoA synthetase (AMP-forming)/AMP-acid ligase II
MIISTPDLTEHLILLAGEPKMANLCITLNFGFFAPLQEATSSTQPDHFIQIKETDIRSVKVATPAVARSLKDIAALIYTSGTSGKPKAVSVKNDRYAVVSVPVPNDSDNPKKYFPMRTFSCLPLFHATALYTGLLYSMGSSGTFCLGRKFSASGFSRSLAESKATRVLYVGELARYLLKAPPSPYDKAHPCRVASGNGLQRDVWLKFMERFGIDEIREFYRSTEGLAKFDNFSRGAVAAGKVGFQGPIAHYMTTDTILVKYDPATEAPWRDSKTGFCVRAKKGEPGEAIGLVTGMDFYPEYLNNPEANEKKLITNVFKEGDVYQRTGDLLVREPSGWIRFHDRSGDTYRWRGENVSAGEVRELISTLPGVQDVTVYGIKLDG